MLRRAPTKISLTAADVEQYEATRVKNQDQQTTSQIANDPAVGQGSAKTDQSQKDRIMGTGR